VYAKKVLKAANKFLFAKHHNRKPSIRKIFFTETKFNSGLKKIGNIKPRISQIWAPERKSPGKKPFFKKALKETCRSEEL
jgi:hypothetical protein